MVLVVVLACGVAGVAAVPSCCLTWITMSSSLLACTSWRLQYNWYNRCSAQQAVYVMVVVRPQLPRRSAGGIG